MFHLDTATAVMLIVSFFIPLCSALLARAHWPTEMIGVLTLLLSAANGFFTQWADAGDHFAWQAAIWPTVVSCLIAIGAHFGIWGHGTGQFEARLLAFPTAKTAAPAAPAAPPAAPPA